MLGTKVLEERKSEYNGLLRVVKTLGLGVYIQADGLTQSGGIVESIWRKTLRKIRHSKFQIRNVLVLGLGGGTAAKYVRLFWPEAKITGIDIDPLMVELGKKYLGLDEIGIDIKIGDASGYISQKSKVKSYDLVIVDLYNGDKYPEKFEKLTFLLKILRLLKNHGLVVSNRLYYGDKRPEAVKFGKKLGKIFSKVEWFYPEANLMFICKNQI